MKSRVCLRVCGRACVCVPQDLGEDVEQYFQEVVLAVEQSIENGEAGYDQYQTRLQHIYNDILTSANQGVCKGG